MTVPKSVTEIGEEAFDKNCVVNNPNDTFNEEVNKNNSERTDSTTQPVNKPDNAFDNELDKTTFKDGHLFVGKEIENKKITDIVSIPKEKIKSVIIEDGVTKIGNGAFYDCTSLTSVTIPDSVTAIDSNAFLNCTGLTSITIPDSVTKIGECAFYGCTGLKEVTVPKSAKVDDNTFDENTTVHRK